ncbi:MAG TPA: hypothetical protein DC054_06375 [Blastocatellia bacterium]|nr:hypothetical protein [Blastocatellia bacterium]
MSVAKINKRSHSGTESDENKATAGIASRLSGAPTSKHKIKKYKTIEHSDFAFSKTNRYSLSCTLASYRKRAPFIE